MIELKNFEVKMVSGGMYYTMLGSSLGGLATTGWFLSLTDRDAFKQSDAQIMMSMGIMFASIGSIFGTVVGYAIDTALLAGQA